MATTFRETINEMLALHDKKNHDYGTVGDPFANVRASEDFGVDAWLGTIIRLNDKITRIKSFARNGNLENESLRDSLIDIAVYAAIALTLYDQATLTQWLDTEKVHAEARQAERIQHYPSKVAEVLANKLELKPSPRYDDEYFKAIGAVDKPLDGSALNGVPVYECKGDCENCTCNKAEELCICGAGGVDIDCEAHGDIRCDATRYHLGEDRVCELRANHDGPHENWHTAAIHGTAPLQWAGKPEPVRAE